MLDLAWDLGVKQFILTAWPNVYGVNPNVPRREDDHVLKPISRYTTPRIKPIATAAIPGCREAVVNRVAQHSQALHAIFIHVPSLKVVMPGTPSDAKGLLIAAVNDENPVLYIDDRWLYDDVGDVSQACFAAPIRKAAKRRAGSDVTIVGISYMARKAVGTGEQLAAEGIDAEVIDLRTVKPWDKELVPSSVCKTGRSVVTDSGWHTCGASAEIVCTVSVRLSISSRRR